MSKTDVQEQTEWSERQCLNPLPFTFSAGTTREHLGLAMALKVPIFIVISKVDLCTPGTVERTVRQLERVLKQPGCNKVPMVIASTDDAVTAAQQFAQSPTYDIHHQICTGTISCFVVASVLLLYSCRSCTLACSSLQNHAHLHFVQRVWGEPRPAQGLLQHHPSTQQQ